jgi:cobalt-zinc-cadmium efflux system outer membrane protein
MFGKLANSRSGAGTVSRALAAPAFVAALVATAAPLRSSAQTATPSDSTVTGISAIVRRATEANPAIHAAKARLTAAQARIGPAGTAPDPMLMAGLVNFPIASSGGMSEPMTMKMIGVSQTVIYPGKLSLARRSAVLEADGARAALDVTRRDVVRRATVAYYEIAYLDRALDVAKQTSMTLSNVIRVTESRYSTGAGAQEDVLKARVESARLSETANALMEQRRAVLATLNAALDQRSDEPLVGPAVEDRVAHAALAHDVDAIRFTAQTLGATAADSPLPSVPALQQLAIDHSPGLREHEAMIAAQAARVQLAEKERKPDIDLSLRYGQRSGRPDMVSAEVSIPLKLHRRAREDQQLAEAISILEALHAEHVGQVNALREQVATLAAELDRNRTQLALYAKAILPESRAAVTAALTGYQAGRGNVLTVLDGANTVFSAEIGYYRALSDFAKNLAKLEEIVGAEVLP